MNPSPAFQFYPAIYLADQNIILMTPRQRGAYWHLCCISWGSTPIARLLNDPVKLAKMSGLTKEEWNEDGPAILGCFSIDADGYITQKRLMDTYHQQLERRAQTAEAGAASAKKRGHLPRKTRTNNSLNADALDRSTAAFNGDANTRSTVNIPPVQPLTILSLTGTNLSTDISCAETVYSIYPRKAAKPTALKAIRRAIKEHGADFVIEKTREYAAARIGEDEKWTPYPAKWFSDQMFNDPGSWKPAPKPEPYVPQHKGEF